MLHRESRLNRTYDRCTFAIMAKVLQPDSNCVDVGCHTGQMLDQMLRNCPEGKQFAFEPLPNLAEQLRRQFPEVEVFEVALSDTEGKAQFRHVIHRPAYSGLKERAYPSQQEETEVITVKTDMLDHLVDREVPIRFIKIDVEGGELQVLRGAVETIRAHKPHVVFEHGKGAADYYGTTPQQVYDLLVEDCGMRISLMQDWLAKKPPLARDAFIAQFENHINFYFLAHA